MNARVREARKTLRLNQVDFGVRLGVTAAAISKIESGERGLTEQMILAICREFGVNEDWLRTGEGGAEAMFDETDDTIIADMAREYGLDKITQTILKTYVELPKERREHVNKFIREAAGAIMDDNVSKARQGIHDAIMDSNAPSLVKSDLIGKTLLAFTDAFPYIGIGNVEQDELDALDTVRVYYAAKSTDNAEGGYVDIPRTTLEKFKSATPVDSDDEI